MAEPMAPQMNNTALVPHWFVAGWRGRFQLGGEMKSSRGGQTVGASHSLVLLWASIVVAALLGMCSAASADTVFSDNFETALSGWTLNGSVDWYTGTPKNGTHSVQVKQNESLERTISTVGYSSITVSFALAANGLDDSGEYVRARWYDGSNWTTLKQIRGGDAENDNVLRVYSYVLPAGAADCHCQTPVEPVSVGSHPQVTGVGIGVIAIPALMGVVASAADLRMAMLIPAVLMGTVAVVYVLPWSR
jgi:hypothetical protein